MLCCVNEKKQGKRAALPRRFDTTFTSGNHWFARVRFAPMHFPFLLRRTFILAGLLAASAMELSAQSHAIWVDVVPMTRRLFGAENESGNRMTAGWSSNLSDSGWRVLVGASASQETQDSFGTSITTKNQDMAVRAGHRWFTRSQGDAPACRPVWGADVIFRRDHIGTTSSNIDFTATNPTTDTQAGVSGIIGIDLRLAPKLHLVTEVRFDAVYRRELNVQEDNFSGRFEQLDNGWQAQLDPPLQLYVALGL